jgi:hypothetical protein
LDGATDGRKERVVFTVCNLGIEINHATGYVDKGGDRYFAAEETFLRSIAPKSIENASIEYLSDDIFVQKAA